MNRKTLARDLVRVAQMMIGKSRLTHYTFEFDSGQSLDLDALGRMSMSYDSFDRLIRDIRHDYPEISTGDIKDLKSFYDRIRS